MKRTQDLKAQYQLQMDEEGILLAAATILEQRLQRQGRIHSPEQAGSYLVAPEKPPITQRPQGLDVCSGVPEL
ncbi:hypothetical protein VDR33_22120, partial [Xanthomonas campestris pv. campestris]|nr:hypothetical protein [Xanthomonas campestris pv. campestris]